MSTAVRGGDQLLILKKKSHSETCRPTDRCNFSKMDRSIKAGLRYRTAIVQQDSNKPVLHTPRTSSRSHRSFPSSRGYLSHDSCFPIYQFLSLSSVAKRVQKMQKIEKNYRKLNVHCSFSLHVHILPIYSFGVSLTCLAFALLCLFSP